jgi:hypothetical protein
MSPRLLYARVPSSGDTICPLMRRVHAHMFQGFRRMCSIDVPCHGGFGQMRARMPVNSAPGD